MANYKIEYQVIATFDQHSLIDGTYKKGTVIREILFKSSKKEDCESWILNESWKKFNRKDLQILEKKTNLDVFMNLGL